MVHGTIYVQFLFEMNIFLISSYLYFTDTCEFFPMNLLNQTAINLNITIKNPSGTIMDPQSGNDKYC